MGETDEVLVVVADTAFARSLEILLEDELACTVIAMATVGQALERLRSGPRPKLVVGDVESIGEALGLVRTVRRSWPSVQVLLLTAHHLGHLRAAGLRIGAAAVLPKPLDPGPFLGLVQKALES